MTVNLQSTLTRAFLEPSKGGAAFSPIPAAKTDLAQQAATPPPSRRINHHQPTAQRAAPPMPVVRMGNTLGARTVRIGNTLPPPPPRTFTSLQIACLITSAPPAASTAATFSWRDFCSIEMLNTNPNRQNGPSLAQALGNLVKFLVQGDALSREENLDEANKARLIFEKSQDPLNFLLNTLPSFCQTLTNEDIFGITENLIKLKNSRRINPAAERVRNLIGSLGEQALKDPSNAPLMRQIVRNFYELEQNVRET